MKVVLKDGTILTYHIAKWFHEKEGKMLIMKDNEIVDSVPWDSVRSIEIVVKE